VPVHCEDVHEVRLDTVATLGDMDTTRLESLLEQTGPAHHEAYIETDGVDPEWPLWYAEYLIDSLNAELGTSLTKSQLVYLLVDLERRHSMVAPDMAWFAFYAREIANRTAGGALT
jgi:hypothetical protein